MAGKTLITGTSDVRGGGMTGWGPVSAESGIFAGTPHEDAVSAVANIAVTQARFFFITQVPRKNHANKPRMVCLKS